MLGHFAEHEDFSLPSFLHTDEMAAEMMASLVGASREEVAVMETLTANLHFLMSSFYKPTKEKYKIILEGKAFPSDHVGIFGSVASDKRSQAFQSISVLFLAQNSAHNDLS